MKKRMAFCLALVLALSLAGCAHTVKEPPALQVACGSSGVAAWRGSYSWHYQTWAGNSTGVDSDSKHPLQAKKSMEPLVLPDDGDAKVLLRFDLTPDEVTVRCWSEEYWEQPDAEGESVAVTVRNLLQANGADETSYMFQPKAGYIYEVCAQWNSAKKYSGAARYAFYTQPSGADTGS